jgi:hypothetical protein
MSNNVPAQKWKSVASSADGSKLFAATFFGQLYITTNSGNTWTSNAAPNGAWAIACSADGKKVVAAAGNSIGRICTSTNSGITWVTNNSPFTHLQSVASSADGTKLAAVEGGGAFGPIYTSTDSGITWASNNVPLLSWQSIASSANGTKLAAAAWQSSGNWTGPIYTSTNSGLNWISNNFPNLILQGLASSADGNEFVVITAGTGTQSQFGTGRVWILQTVPNPVLSLVPSGNNLALSWIIPSANFALQQNLDLTTTNWVMLTNTPTLNLTNLNNELTLSPSNSSGFFRLMAQ